MSSPAIRRLLDKEDVNAMYVVSNEDCPRNVIIDAHRAGGVHKVKHWDMAFYQQDADMKLKKDSTRMRLLKKLMAKNPKTPNPHSTSSDAL